MHKLLPDNLDNCLRARTALMNTGIATVEDLCLKTETELSGIPNFGKKSLLCVRLQLRAMGRALKDSKEFETRKEYLRRLHARKYMLEHKIDMVRNMTDEHFLTCDYLT